MRPTLSELGEYDGTALMEFKTKKNVTYQLFRDAVCTYEMDDTPPFAVNEEALEIALEIALLLDCSIVDELHISRKQYLDGSIPTGFQRTGIVGVEGSVPVDGRNVRIIQLGLEEDACREVEDRGHEIVFRTDRLSIPLVEVVTYPDMHSPEEIAAAAWQIGRLLRVTGKVRRGIGTVRQDVNVSIEGGTRVEIKGVPRIGLIPPLAENEARRQAALLRIRDELRNRGITEQNLAWDKADFSDILAGTAAPLLREAIDRGDVVRGIVLRGFAGILDEETQPGVRFAREFSGRVRVIACLDRLPNIMTTSDLQPSGVSPSEIAAGRSRVGARVTDEIVLVWGGEDDVETALEEIRIRAAEATRGVPNETRQALADGITDFERILPGPDRMYPDTDSPPIPLARSHIDAIADHLPERPWQREKRYEALGLSEELAYPLAVSPRADLFDRVVEELDVRPTVAAVTVTQTLKAMRRAGLAVSSLTDERLAEAFACLAAGRFYREALPDVLRALASDEEAGAEDALDRLDLRAADEDEARAVVDDVVARRRADCERLLERDATGSRARRLVMGASMETLRGRFAGATLADLVQEALAGKSGRPASARAAARAGRGTRSAT